jgi:hypothetical protein
MTGSQLTLSKSRIAPLLLLLLIFIAPQVFMEEKSLGTCECIDWEEG